MERLKLDRRAAMEALKERVKRENSGEPPVSVVVAPQIRPIDRLIEKINAINSSR